MKIYLAGKVGGIKWEVAKAVSIPGVTFVASDGSNHSEHLWGMSIWWEFGYQGHRELIEEWATNAIDECDMLVAILDETDSYGSIAEIAWASAKGKPCLVLLIAEYFREIDEPVSFDDEEEFYANQRNSISPMFDAYWFVCAFPNVIPITVYDDIYALVVLENFLKLESPIEKQFYLAALQEDRSLFDCMSAQEPVKANSFTYRADFMVEHRGRFLAIELDGHDSHKTKEQRTHDAQKDRYFKSKGIDVIRFTGSEVYRDAVHCVREVRSLLSDN